ncbi:MAG: phosphotransferase [Granulosicoccus sp.]|nr:phosphotransferase [Granulosicoccus sp.]
MSYQAYVSIVRTLYSHAKLIAVERLTGGVSADVHRLDLKLQDGSFLSLVVREHGSRHCGHDVELEYKLLQSLYTRGLPVPKPLLVDCSARILENPFLVMSFIEGSSVIAIEQSGSRIDAMAETLARIHAVSTEGLPALPMRTDPLPEVLDFLPADREWNNLRDCLRSLTATDYLETPKLLHGDYWPENILWSSGAVAGILDWEDSAIGDPLSDVATCCVELRYLFGKASMRCFTQAYARYRSIDHQRLALWLVYVAAAAQCFMGDWGLDAARENHMRSEALSSIREAAAQLMD